VLIALGSTSVLQYFPRAQKIRFKKIEKKNTSIHTIYKWAIFDFARLPQSFRT